ncbi:hypothetical protein SCE1572_44650 [Sorangium cellulosum So0157-2]|uniref:Uncharacterized protein n=1 Tax=Sorangium cellulosum So0157-2 TaxID=1254432 RepID=S4Y9H8_SORCE|nr:hypothetical protein SCE1572_44650 [Sorangium cellulosum So0157-2]
MPGRGVPGDAAHRDDIVEARRAGHAAAASLVRR